MDVALVGVPEWVAPPRQPLDGEDEVDVRTPFGVYLLLHELTAASRRILGTDRVLVWAALNRGSGGGRGLRTGLNSHQVASWAKRRGLTVGSSSPQSASGSLAASALDLRRLRLTHLELHQRPVAHAQLTLANDYLLRNRGNITEYQRIVADVLAQEVTKARTRAALRTLTADEVEQARTDPKTIEARHGLDAATLRRLLASDLDTVMASCSDPLTSPHSRSGQLCQASFMLCLSCANARALPHHLPLQVAVHDALLARQAEMTPLRWAQRYGLPHSQLADLLVVQLAIEADVKYWVVAQKHSDLRDHFQRLTTEAKKAPGRNPRPA